MREVSRSRNRSGKDMKIHKKIRKKREIMKKGLENGKKPELAKKEQKKRTKNEWNQRNTKG